MKFFKMIALLLIISTNSVIANSADITMSFGDRIPPFCFPETNSGIELEVMREALAYRGHVLRPKYFALARIPLEFKRGTVDAAMTDLGEYLSAAEGYYGEPAVWYDNVFITLKERNIKINKPKDLNGLAVISFQGAVKRYPKWLEPVRTAGNYYEENNQKIQILTLDKGRYDVVLSDRSIFKYFTLQIQKETGFSPKPTHEHEFVKLNLMDYRPVFKDKKIRDDFNAGLRHLKETGRYQAIYDRYLKE